jgi:Ca2+-binding RTX toxin-like protein
MAKKNSIIGTELNDMLEATQDGDMVYGLGGDDTLLSEFNDTKLYGGGENDLLSHDYSKIEIDANSVITSLLDGGQGNDQLLPKLISESTSGTASLTSVMNGGAGNDIFGTDSSREFQAKSDSGTASISSIINGGAGDDRANLSSGMVAEGAQAFSELTFDGGSGSDWLASYFEAQGVERAEASSVAMGGDGDDFLNVGTVATGEGEAKAHSYLEGGAGDDRLIVFTWAAGSSAEITTDLYGGSGNDHLTSEANGGVSADKEAKLTQNLYGGAGDDWLDLQVLEAGLSGESATVRSNLDGGSGNDTLEAFVEFYEINAAEQPSIVTNMNGGSGADVLDAYAIIYGPVPDGSKMVQTLDGGNDDDVLFGEIADGSIGYSHLLGGQGNDELAVNGGTNNIMEGGEGNDISHGAFESRDGFVYAQQKGGNNGFDTIYGFEQGGETTGDKVLLIGYSPSDLDYEGNIAMLNDGTEIRFDNVAQLDDDDFEFVESMDGWIA